MNDDSFSGQEPQQRSNYRFPLPSPAQKFRALFGRKAAVGVVAGLAMIVLDLLFFAFAGPVGTTLQFIESIGLLDLGILISGISSVSGLTKVSNARRKKRLGNG